MGRTKTERVAWWNGLSDDEKETYIARRQQRKTKWRKMHPKEPVYDPKYPWATDGVNGSNRQQWQRTILAKNPWLDETIFSKKNFESENFSC